VALQTNECPWIASNRKGVAWKKLYAQQPYTDHVRLERWEEPSATGTLNFPQGAELFVLKGSFADKFGSYRTHCWLRIPAGGNLTPAGNDYCELYIKEGGFTYLN
jgi:hypothetical protein